MKKLLHIIATPRAEESNTLQISNVFLEVFRKKHPDWFIDELDLSREVLPSLTLKRVDGKYVLLEGKELSGELKEAWNEIITHIQRFISSDGYLITTPMWNFSIPYTLKQYIDIIVQPKYLFRYTQSGVEGLVKNRKIVIIASRGGDYTSEQMKKFDFQEPYLRAVFGFVGIADVSFVIAQPVNMGQELQQKSIAQAKELGRKIVAEF